ncbi:TonB-dependent siderophore receptor [Acinetobacter vivianii]
MTPIKVTASKDTQGTAEQGYKEDTVSQVGLWQGRSLQQLPYSIQVFSNDLLKNIQATSNPDEIYRLNPTSQLSRSQYENDQPVTYTRGFRVANAYRDGMEGDQYGHGTTTEDAKKIEVFNGLSGFLYGPGNVGGLINYVTKRSTDTRLNEINLANLGGKSWYTHADFGGKFDDAGKFGYRLNLAKQGGDTAIKQQEIKKDFVSLALDWQALDSLLIQVDAMQRDYDINGGAANWNFAKGIDRLSADRLKNNISWSVPWTNNYHSERYGAHLKWTPNQNITIRSSYLDSYSRRGTQLTTNTVTSDHTYDQTVSRVYAAGIDRMSSQQYDKRWATYVDFAFDTGQISHKLTTGLQMSDTQQKRYQRSKGSGI